MASSEVAIVNLALAKLGEESLTALTDENPAGRLANRNYASLRDAVLRERQWNCATRRTTLSKLATAPTFGFSNAFALPADFVRLIQLEDQSDDFRIENTTDGRVVVSDNNSVNLVYIFRLTDVVKMDELLKQAIAARLAWEFAYKLTGDRNLRNDMAAEYQRVLAEAAHVDALEAPVETIQPSEWVEARLGIHSDSYKSRTRLV